MPQIQMQVKKKSLFKFYRQWTRLTRSSPRSDAIRNVFIENTTDTPKYSSDDPFDQSLN